MNGVRLATAADLGRATTTATRAFADDPLLRWFFPAAEVYAAAAPEVFAHLTATSVALGCAYVTADAVAVGAYLPPGRPEPEAAQREHGALVPPPELAARFAALSEAVHAHTPPEPHWYLSMLATHPDWQRQGLGASIVAPVAERCDREGLPLYLETQTESNVAYYERLGFTVRTEWDLPDGGPHMWGMSRRPGQGR